MTSAGARLKAVLLDVDGTLVDSNEGHAAAWREALRRHGFDVELATIRPLIGMGGDKMLPLLTGHEEGSPAGRRIAEDRTAIFLAEHLPRIAPFPGVRDLVSRMRHEGLTIVVASSASDEELGALLRVAGIADLLSDSTSSDDADRSKPDPDIVHAALQRAGASPVEALLVGDTRYDVEAGRRAGIPVIALRSGGSPEDAFAGAAAVYDGPADLLRRFDASLLAAGQGC